MKNFVDMYDVSLRYGEDGDGTLALEHATMRVDRGEFVATARVEDGVREGTVWAPSIWWGKYAADGKNANDTTSQRETDMGHGPVFYDNLVEVSPAD